MILLSSLEYTTLGDCVQICKRQPEEELLGTINEMRINEKQGENEGE